jgi:hypothetical protein
VPPSPSPSPTSTDPCADGKCTPTQTPEFDPRDFIFDAKWSLDDREIAKDAIRKVGEKLSTYVGGGTSTAVFTKVYGTPFTFLKMEDAGSGCKAGQRLVKCNPAYNIKDPRLIVHELGHALQHSRYINDTQGPYASLETAAITDDRGLWVTGKHPGGLFDRTALGYVSENPPDMYHGKGLYPTTWNSNESHEARNEDFADMYMNWVYNSFDYRSTVYGAGTNRYNWIEDHIAGWIQG